MGEVPVDGKLSRMLGKGPRRLGPYRVLSGNLLQEYEAFRCRVSGVKGVEFSCKTTPNRCISVVNLIVYEQDQRKKNNPER